MLPSTTDSSFGGGGGGSGGTVATSSLLPSPSATSAPSNGGGPSVNPKLVGGIVGGLAGLGLVLALILFLLRRHKRNLVIRARVEAGYGGPPGPEVGDTGDNMTQRSSATPLAAAAGFFRQQSRHSRQSQVSEPASEERGFYKVSGRKLPPVIGGPRPDFPSTRSVADSSFYHDEEAGWVGGPGTPVSSAGGAGGSGGGPSSMRHSFTASTASPTSTAAGSSAPPFGHAVSPVSSGVTPGGAAAVGAVGASRIPEEDDDSDYEDDATPRAPRPPMFPRQLSATGSKDGVGRSLPSHDGSRASKFTEDIG